MSAVYNCSVSPPPQVNEFVDRQTPNASIIHTDHLHMAWENWGRSIQLLLTCIFGHIAPGYSSPRPTLTEYCKQKSIFVTVTRFVAQLAVVRLQVSVISGISFLRVKGISFISGSHIFQDVLELAQQSEMPLIPNSLASAPQV
ncbi:hypothetical protein STEG23_022813, partial [Scotinomys teguina]